MLRKEGYFFLIGILVAGTNLARAESGFRQTCESGLVNELNQNLQEEAVSLKYFLETRKQDRLQGRDRVEACSHWSVMNSYAKSMAKHLEEASPQEPVTVMVDHLKTDLENNNDCWTSHSPAMAGMLDGVRIILTRTMRLAGLLSNSEAEVAVGGRELATPR